ncbi:SDR family oxidoreductase [Streptomyces fagopyri]|uniref:SDR family oxidoreductase n=1 Tax=Streptomyces fagopyri TaxID=2662397 RepID=UPI0033D9EF49
MATREQALEQEQSGKPKPKRVLYPYGTASAERDDTITVLGALKVATATQIMRLVRPHLTDNKAIHNALLDLQKHGLVVSEGNTPGPRGRIGSPGRCGPAAQKLWRLTAASLDYAEPVMGEGVDGGLARGVARGGAKHAMAVNETVSAFVRGGTVPDSPAASAGSRRSEPRSTCTASIAGLIGDPDMAPYVAAKHGVIGLTMAAAVDYAQAGVRVNALAPGLTETPMTRAWRHAQAKRDIVLAGPQMHRAAKPEEMVGMVLYLSSPLASFATGCLYVIDGGQTAH